MKKNQVITLEIIDLTNLGFGVGRYEGQVVFVSDAVTGDTVKARIIKVGSSYSVARVEEYLKKSALRVNDRCSNSLCKSCAYKAISYKEECLLKEESVRQIFKKAELSNLKIVPVVGSPLLREYRNKAQYPISKSKSGEYSIGFFAPKSHRVTEAADCPLAPTIFAEINETLRIFFKENSLSVYDVETGEGLLRHIYLRRGEVSREVLLTLVINGDSIPGSDELVKKITERFPSVVGILINKNKKETNVILGDEYVTLFGRDYIFDTLSGVKLKISAQSFYQVNHGATENLYAKAKELCQLNGNELVLDLYCGLGSIGLSMAKNCREVIGIEIVESAVECARENARNNGINNASFYVGDASEARKLLLNAESKRNEAIKPDIIILDPPRAGSTPELIEYAAELNPQRIVYISCNPSTLARDMKEFKKLGYLGDEVFLYDLFAATGHVESLVCLQKQTN